MKAFYKKALHKERQKKVNVIAALVCENREAAGEEQFKTVILASGTKFNIGCNFYVKHKNTDEYCWGTCDGHAEAICYQLASVYMLEEIGNLINEKNDSIFQLAAKGGYELKKSIKFHLFVSHRPCGFMTNKNIQCLLSWKIHFTKKPHILECSSKILIGSFLGIQGPLSFLLAKPVYISNVVIAEHFQEPTNKKGNKLHNLKRSNLEPSIPEIKNSFVKFSQNLQSNPEQSPPLLASQFDMTSNQHDADFAVHCPHIFIWKVDLYKHFPRIKPPSVSKSSPATHSYFTFMHCNNVEQLDFGNGSNIVMYMKKMFMQIHLKKMIIRTHISPSTVYHQLKAFSDAIAKASQALYINRVLDDATTKTKEYIEAKFKERDEIKERIYRRTYDLDAAITHPKLGIEFYNQCLIKNQTKSTETLEGLEKKLCALILNVVEAKERYNTFDIFRLQNCSSLTEIDCDWENCKQKMQYILLSLLK